MRKQKLSVSKSCELDKLVTRENEASNLTRTEPYA